MDWIVLVMIVVGVVTYALNQMTSAHTTVAPDDDAWFRALPDDVQRWYLDQMEDCEISTRMVWPPNPGKTVRY